MNDLQEYSDKYLYDNIKDGNSYEVNKILEKISLKEMSIKPIFEYLPFYDSIKDQTVEIEKCYKSIKPAYDSWLGVMMILPSAEAFRDFIESIITNKKSYLYTKYSNLLYLLV